MANYVKCKWPKPSVKTNRVTEWKKKQDPSICHLQETKIEWIEKDIPCK